MALSLDDIARLFEAKGGRRYSGEAVTQLEHALQSAQLAERAGAGDALITAALLHDLGHLINDLGETPTLRHIDDKHQHVVLTFLRGLFADDVLQPIKLHVDAKRYLCVHGDGTLSGAEYWAALSEDSRRSLELQGGVLGAAEAEAFIAQPYAREAVRLRCWDDRAKVEGTVTPPLSHYLAIAARVARR